MVLAPAGRLAGALWVRLVTAQLSLAVAALNWAAGKPQGLPLPLTDILGGQLILGNWASFTVTVKEQVLELLTISKARHTTVLLPVGNTDPLAKPLNRLAVLPVQLSEKAGEV